MSQRDFESGPWTEKLEDSSLGVRSAWETQCQKKGGPQQDLEVTPLSSQQESSSSSACVLCNMEVQDPTLCGRKFVKKQGSVGQTPKKKSYRSHAKKLWENTSLRHGLASDKRYRCEQRWNTSTQAPSTSWRLSSEVCRLNRNYVCSDTEISQKVDRESPTRRLKRHERHKRKILRWRIQPPA